MKNNRTLAIIKPDAVGAGLTGQIIELIERSGFTIAQLEKRQLSKAQAERFYDIHKARSFFGELVSFMTSGPVVVMVLERDAAVAAWRDLMGATNPAEARIGTLRQLFGKNIGENATHGSDSDENAAVEIEIMFPNLQ